MKKTISLICFILLLIICVSGDSFAENVSTTFQYKNAAVGAGAHYKNKITTEPSSGVVYRTYRRPGIMYNNFVTPPPPPPKRYRHRYSDFAGKRNFPVRSYYIPSYCMPVNDFYMNSNPFCNQYRPYGSNIYISF